MWTMIVVNEWKKRVPGGKQHKGRITVALCINVVV